MTDRLDDFERKVRGLLNSLSLEAPSNTPDFALARYLRKCLESYNEAALVSDGGCRFIPTTEPNIPQPLAAGLPGDNIREPG